MAKKTFKFLPVLRKCLKIEITIEFFLIGGAGDTSRRMRAAEIVTDFELLKEQYFEVFVL